MMKLTFLFWSLLGSVCACAAVGAAPKSYAFREGDMVTFSGKLERVWNFGPPNYGENPESDRIITYIILKPDHPIGVDGGDPARHAQRVRLMFPYDRPALWKKVNSLVSDKAVSVSGRLRLQYLAIEMEPILLDIADVKSVVP